MYSYYDDDTVELDLDEEEDDDEYNQSQPSESPYPNRRVQSRSSSENGKQYIIDSSLWIGDVTVAFLRCVH